MVFHNPFSKTIFMFLFLYSLIPETKLFSRIFLLPYSKKKNLVLPLGSLKTSANIWVYLQISFCLRKDGLFIMEYNKLKVLKSHKRYSKATSSDMKKIWQDYTITNLNLKIMITLGIGLISVPSSCSILCNANLSS